MKILLATPIYPPEIGGPATYTKEISKRLVPEHEITIVTYANDVEPLPGTRLVMIDKRGRLPVRIFRYFLAVMREAKHVDVIYVQNAMASGLPAMFAARILRKPILLKFVGDEAWERATQWGVTEKRLEDFLLHPEGGWRIRVMMLIQGFVLRRVSKVFTPSAYLRDVLVKIYRIRPERSAVNYNAAEEVAAAPFDAVLTPHKIAVTARLVAWKGVDGILRALKILLERYPDATLAVAGDGPEEDRLHALADELGISKNVQFLGRVSHAETWHLRKESEVYILNSTYEGLPHTVLTSFAAGIPTIATDIPGTNEAVYHEQSGLLVPSGDDQALADAIARIFEDKQLGERLVEGGKKILKEKFSWEAHRAMLLSLLGSLVAKP